MPVKSRTAADHVAKIIVHLMTGPRTLGELCTLVGLTDERNNRSFIHMLIQALIANGLAEIVTYGEALAHHTFRWKART